MVSTQTKRTPTIAQFKRWATDCQPAAKAVLMARVFAQMERERVDAYILPIFEAYKFEYGAIARGQLTGRISTPRELYLADDGPKMADYYAECDQAHRAQGFTGPIGHCPALVAENLTMITERALMDLAEPLFGIESTQIFGENRTKYPELLIGACFAKDAR